MLNADKALDLSPHYSLHLFPIWACRGSADVTSVGQAVVYASCWQRELSTLLSVPIGTMGCLYLLCERQLGQSRDCFDLRAEKGHLVYIPKVFQASALSPTGS